MGHIYADNQPDREKQWGRLRAVTAALTLELELIRRLQTYIQACKGYQGAEWYRPHPDTPLLRELAHAIKVGEDRLKSTTQILISLQSELENLRTVLNDEETI